MSAILLIAISAPFIWAHAVAVPDLQFTGILNEPLDGSVYLAAMRQGYEGEWTFTLPFVGLDGAGAFVAVFYIGLGHIARDLNEPLEMVFNASRLAGGLVMLLSIYRFIADWTDDIRQRRISWGLAVLGSGFGLVFFLLTRQIAPDLLQLPAAFPLQAVFTNAHLPWAISLQVLLAHVYLRFVLDEAKMPITLDLYTVFYALGSLALASIMPMTWLMMVVPSAVVFIAVWVEGRRFPLREFSFGAIGGIFALPVIAYNAWVAVADPAFSLLFAARPVTPLSPLLLAVSLGLVLLFALAGIIGNTRYTDTGHLYLVSWIIISAILLSLPIPFGAMFACGLIIPVSVFAAMGLWRVVLSPLADNLRVTMSIIMVTLAAPSTIAAFLLPIPGILALVGTPFDIYYVSAAEGDALEYLADQSADGVPNVLADQALSLRVPEHGGHVFFDARADGEAYDAATRFMKGESCDILDDFLVDYVLLSERDDLPDGVFSCLDPYVQAFTSGDGRVIIYRIAD